MDSWSQGCERCRTTIWVDSERVIWKVNSEGYWHGEGRYGERLWVHVDVHSMIANRQLMVAQAILDLYTRERAVFAAKSCRSAPCGF